MYVNWPNTTPSTTTVAWYPPIEPLKVTSIRVIHANGEEFTFIIPSGMLCEVEGNIIRLLPQSK